MWSSDCPINALLKKCVVSNYELLHNGLTLAAVTVVPREAPAQAFGVVALTSTGAVTALRVAIPGEDIGTRGTLLQ